MTAANWDVVPTGGEDLIFPDGAARMTTGSNNFPAGTTFNSITFSGTSGGYTIAGNQITLGAGGVVASNTSGTNVLNTALVLAATRTVDVAAGGTLTLGGAITSVGGLTKAGSGTVTLSVANTYSGGTTINAGVLALGHASALPNTVTALFFGGGQLKLFNGTDLSARFSTNASNLINIDLNGQTTSFGTALTSSGGSLTVTNGTYTLSLATHTYSGGTTFHAVTVRIPGLSSTPSTLNATVTQGPVGTGTVTMSGATAIYMPSNNTTFTVANALAIAADASLTMTRVSDNAACNLVFNGPTTFGGNATLAASFTNSYNTQLFAVKFLGMVTLPAAAQVTIGTGAQPIPANFYFGDDAVGAGITFGSGAKIVNNVNLVWLGSSYRGQVFIKGTLVGGGPGQALELGGTLTGVLAENYDTGNFILGPIYNGANDPGLILNSGGVYSIASAASTYAGGTTVTDSMLFFNTSLASTPSTLNATVSSGPFGTGTLTLNGAIIWFYKAKDLAITLANNLVINGGTDFTNRNRNDNGVDTLIFNGPTTFNGSATLKSYNPQNSPPITQFNGTVSLADGAVVTVAANTSAGIDGTMNFGSNAAGAGLTLLSANATGTAGTPYVAATITNTSSKTLTLAGTMSGGAANQRLTLSGSAAITVSNLSDGTNSPGLTIDHSGTVTLSGTNTYAGGTTLTSGTLALSAANVLPSSGVLTLDGGILNLANRSQTIAGLTGTGGSWTTSGALTLTLGGAGSYTYSGNIAPTTASHVILTKSGAGTQVLAGVNTYTGATTISNGTLTVNGSLATGSAVAVSAGAILAGSGSVGAVTVTSGTVSPGTSGAAALTTTSVSYNNSAATFSVDLNGTAAGSAYDQNIVSTGAVTLANCTLSGTLGFTPTVGQTYIIIDKQSAGAVSGTFDGLAEGATVTIAGYAFTISYLGGTGNDVVLTVIPSNRTWSGSGGNSNFSTAGNWDVAPGDGDNLIFPGVANQTVTMDVPFTAGTVTFNSTTAYSIVATNTLTLPSTVTQSGTGTVAISGLVGLGAASEFTGDGSGVVTVSAVMSGGFGLSKSGISTLVLSGANSYTGLSTISAGVLNIRHNTALGTTDAGTVVADGGTLVLQDNITVGNEALTLNGTGALGTGGTITEVGGYRIHTFTGNGTFTASANSTVDILVVGGGGAGGNSVGGGGGAGGLISTSLSLTAANYDVIIGAGGTVPVGGRQAGNNGGDSTFRNVGLGVVQTAIGGGGGGANNGDAQNNGKTGGSGGGGSDNGLAGGASQPGGQANAGGRSLAVDGFAGAGGGGAGQAGENTGVDGQYYGGDGGNGLQSSITGTPTYYAGGGGGRKDWFDRGGSVNGTGGLGGGGDAGSAATFYGGGGGGGTGNPGNGGAGYQGIVIVRYLLSGALKNISGTNVWQGTVTLGSAAKITSDAGSLTFNTAANSITATNQDLTVDGAGAVTVAGTITTGSGTLTKSGAGIVTLGGANTYTGTTTVSAGVLSVTGSIASTATVSVAAGASIGGNGSLAGTISTANTAIIRPGATANTIGTMTLSKTSPITAVTTYLDMDFSGTTCDLITCSGGAGALNLSNLTLRLNSLTSPTGNLTLISYPAGGITNTFANVTGLPSNYTVVVNSTSVILQIDVQAVTLSSPADAAGHTLNVRPALVWFVPAKTVPANLNFQVTLDGAGSATADTTTSAVDFEYHNGTAWAAWSGAVASGADGRKVRWRPPGNLTVAAHTWKVCAVAGGTPGPDSAVRNFTIAAIPFGADLATNGSILAADINLIRTETNLARAFRGLGATAWAETITAKVTHVKKAHLEELRTALTPVFDEAGYIKHGTKPNTISPDTEANFYSEALTQFVTPIKAVHFQRIRDALGGF